MSGLDVKKAVEQAKRYVGELFADEGLINLGLEEVEYDDTHREWHITLGFSRPWDTNRYLSEFAGVSPRSYKVVTIDQQGNRLSVKNRDTANAG